MTEGEETGNASPRSTRAGVGCDKNFPTAFSNSLCRNSVFGSFYAVYPITQVRLNSSSVQSR